MLLDLWIGIEMHSINCLPYMGSGICPASIWTSLSVAMARRDFDNWPINGSKDLLTLNTHSLSLLLELFRYLQLYYELSHPVLLLQVAYDRF